MNLDAAKISHLNLEEAKIELSNFIDTQINWTSFEITLNEADHQKFANPALKAIETLYSIKSKCSDYYNKEAEKIEMNKKHAENLFSKLIDQLKYLIEKVNSTKKISLEEARRPLDCILASISRTSLNFLQEFETLYLDFSNNFSEINNLIQNFDYFEDIGYKIEKLYLPNEFPFEGYTCYNFSNGDWYIGQWGNHKFNGKGAYYHIETDTYYEGEFENNCLIKGRNRDSRGNAYLGSFKNNCKNGQGIQVYANGNIYEGSWVDNYPNGEGTLHYSLGGSSSGTFDNGKLNGKGQEVYTNGDTYEGDFVDGLKHGHGIYKYSCGDYYEGHWQYDLKNGKGKLVYHKKGCYEGDFQDDKKHGFGKEISFKTKEVYIGFFRNDTKSGFGKLSQ
ncbi:unnamed protein product [Blepharisma stoltei]|uniref:MORN repeat protein n=1 Tax=Blepharisma stoltei TaxID=1481888 RepID=A0AAU9ITU8_9CILI|nr:unnamed protein product [Blepharisma stoltei]